MKFRIADTFTASLAKLTGEEQKAVKTTAFDLQLNPANPGMQFHRVDAAKDKHFWSVRVTRDIRIIVHKTGADLLLCYVDHHDPAYDWAARRKIEVHPKTGAAQIIEIRQTVQRIFVPEYVPEEPKPKPLPPVFAGRNREEILGYGVPEEWIEDVLGAAEETLLELCDHLPAEAAEALLDLATGKEPARPAIPSVSESTSLEEAFAHPDAQRRFRVLSNVEELERALEFPWDKWTIFLHPAQRETVTREYSGPARVSGSAGTGKTIVALHRAVFLARKHEDARILLTTFSDVLADTLRQKLYRLISNEPKLAERIEVHALDAIGERLHRLQLGPVRIASRETIEGFLDEATAATGEKAFSRRFLWSEWDQIVDARQLHSWEAYRDVARIGRRTRLPENQREALWRIFEHARTRLAETSLVTHAQVFAALEANLPRLVRPPFDFAIVDEAQDLSIPQLKFLAALGGERSEALFFAGDLGQRIFQQPFSWKSLGVDIRGRSRILRINYRTSHQIREQADRLLGEEVGDVDGNIEARDNTISVFNGPKPEIETSESPEEENEKVATWLQERIGDGLSPTEIGLFVRSEAEFDRAEAAIILADLVPSTSKDKSLGTPEKVSLLTMHRAKGLEFRAVVVMACDDEIIPQQSRIEQIGDMADLEEVYTTERHLLYVACTRARDHLLVTSVNPASEFLDDLQLD